MALAAGLHQKNGNTVFTSADDPNINAVRPYLCYNAINAIESAFDSNYNALLVSVRKNFGAAGIVSGAYTYSKNLTDNSSDRSNAPQNSYNWHEGEYGPATLDGSRSSISTMFIPFQFSKRATGRFAYALRGWEISGILSMYTGSPFTVTTSNADPAGLGLLGNSAASSRPDQADMVQCGVLRRSATGRGAAGQCGTGNGPRPGYGNLDAALMKNFHFTERVYLQLRGEFFNAINQPNPNGFFSTNITSSGFGQISSYRQARLVQIGGKLIF